MPQNDGSVEIRIVGAVDPSVAASANAAKAAVADLGVQTNVSAAAMAAALKQVGGDLSKITPEVLAAAQASAAGRATEAAAATAETAAEAENTAATIANTAAHGANAAGAISNRAVYEGLVLVHEAMAGRFNRMSSSALIMTQALAGQERVASALTWAMSPLGLTVIGLTAAMTAGVVLTYQYEEAQHQLMVSTVGLGAASGVTAGQLRDLADRDLGDLKSSIHDNEQALTAFTAAGVRNTATLDLLKTSTADFAALTGQKTTAAVKELAEAMKDPEKGAEKINEQLGFLDSTQLRAIESAQNLGDKYQAQALLAQDVHDKTEQAAIAAGGLQSAWHSLGVVASDTARFVGGLAASISGVELASELANKANAGAIAAVQRQRQLAQDSAAAKDLVDATPEGQAQTHREKLQGDVNTVSRALNADIQLYGEHSAAVAKDRQALDEYRRALTTYLSPIEKKIAADKIDAQIAQARAGHNKALVQSLTEQKALLQSAGEVMSKQDAQALASGAGAVGGARVHGVGASVVQEWSQQLHDQEIASGEFFKDQTEKELAFWQQKLAQTKAGSKEWLEVQAKIYEASKTLAHQDYQDHLADLNDRLEADRNNWAKEQADWQEKLAYIRSTHGEEGAEYQNAHRQFEAEERRHAEQMAQIEQERERSALQTLRRSLDAQRSIREADTRTQESLIQEGAQGSPFGQISAAMKIAVLHHQLLVQQMADDQAYQAAQDAALDSELSKAASVYGTESQRYQRLIHQKMAADQEFAAKHRQLEDRMVNQTVQDQLRIRQAYRGVIDPLVQSWGSGIQGIIEGTESWGQALTHVASTMLGVVVTAIEHMVEEWILNLILGKAQQQTIASTTALSYVGVAGAAGVASMAAAPFPIDLAAPAFGAQMASVAAGYATLASLDTGTNFVPQDMIAQIHEGERIIPAADNTALMNAVGAGDRGGDHFHIHSNMTVNNNGKTAVELTQDHMRQIIVGLQKASRNRPGSLRFA